ncbi:hypothetical protein EMIT0P12_20315 [Pseudomonas sp. IT-P12]
MGDQCGAWNSRLSSARFTARSASMMICWIPNSMWRCGPSTNTERSPAKTLAEASDSQALASRVSVSMSGAMENIVLGVWGDAVFGSDGSKAGSSADSLCEGDSGGLGVGFGMVKAPVTIGATSTRR